MKRRINLLITALLFCNSTGHASADLLPPLQYDAETLEVLLGEDIDGNEIRDYYEDTIKQSGFPDDLEHYALQAGKAYSRVMMLARSPDWPDQQHRRKLLRDLTHAELCRREMQRHYGKAWKKSDFFNSLNRIEANFKLQARLARATAHVEKLRISDHACSEIQKL